MKDPKVFFFVYKKMGEVLDKLKVRYFNATSLSTVLPGFKWPPFLLFQIALNLTWTMHT